ncbi:MAG: hypothetical protein JXR86_01620 [Spirochaetales bacterium]|nr:hypothetical protein [Spirochaetales bacterium]
MANLSGQGKDFRTGLEFLRWYQSLYTSSISSTKNEAKSDWRHSISLMRIY